MDDDDKPHAGKDDLTNSMAQMALRSPHTLSHIEQLPAELVQDIAAYLVRGYQGDPRDNTYVREAGASSFDGLLELRATSRTILAKTEHVFNGSFETAVIGYEAKSLLRLWKLSTNSTLCPRVRSLVFVGSPLKIFTDKAYHQQNLIEFLDSPGMNELLLRLDMITALITTALEKFQLHAVLIAPSLVTFYSRDVTDMTSPAWPATTVIFNSVLLSKIWLKRFEMGGGEWGTCEGIQPAETQISARGRLGWSQVQDLISISLCLSSSDYHPSTNGLASMLRCAWNLEHLSLKMDIFSMEDPWPYLDEPQVLWMNEIANNSYWNLKILALSGFVFERESLYIFLAHHKQSLVEIKFDNCDLDGEWDPIFDLLRDSPCLEMLHFHQISEFTLRVAWLDEHDIILVENMIDDWIQIICGFQHHYTLEAHATAAEWDDLSDKLRVSTRQANPFMEDALAWYPEYLN